MGSKTEETTLRLFLVLSHVVMTWTTVQQCAVHSYWFSIHSSSAHITREMVILVMNQNDPFLQVMTDLSSIRLYD
jgi:hypothetical protein